MRALIVGDSQAQGAGAVLQAKLQAQGWTVTRSAEHGIGSGKVLQLAQAQAGKPFDLVVVFSGSVADGMAAVKGIPKLWPHSKIVWYGASPATSIGNLALAQEKFGKHVKTADHWFKSGEAAAREQRNAQLKAAMVPGVVYVDWRKLHWPYGLFPAQADGIHVGKSSAEIAFSAPNWPPQDSAILEGGWGALAVGLLVWVAHRRGWLG